MHVILRHVELLYVTIHPRVDGPYTFFVILFRSSPECPESILWKPDNVVAALEDIVRLL